MSTSHRVRKIHNHLHNRSTMKYKPRLLPVSQPDPVKLMAKAAELETLECAWYVGQRRPLSDLAFWKRWLVRVVYFSVGWCTGDGIEAQAICTSKELAERMAAREGWFYHELPINTPLPDETCRFRAHVFPGSEARDRYETISPSVATVHLAEIERLEAKIEQVLKRASS